MFAVEEHECTIDEVQTDHKRREEEEEAGIVVGVVCQQKTDRVAPRQVGQQSVLGPYSVSAPSRLACIRPTRARVGRAELARSAVPLHLPRLLLL